MEKNTKKKIEAYFGISIGLIFIIGGFLMGASGVLDLEGSGNPEFCYLGLIVFGIIALSLGLYDFNKLEKK